MKKLVSLALVFVLVLSMCTVAVADSSRTYTASRNVMRDINVFCAENGQTYISRTVVAGAQARYLVTHNSVGVPVSAVLQSYGGISTRLSTDVKMSTPVTGPIVSVGSSVWAVTVSDFSLGYNYYNHVQVAKIADTGTVSKYVLVGNPIYSSDANLSMTFNITSYTSK